MRNCLQPAARSAADKNAVTHMKYTKWEGGKPVSKLSVPFLPLKDLNTEILSTVFINKLR